MLSKHRDESDLGDELQGYASRRCLIRIWISVCGVGEHTEDVDSTCLSPVVVFWFVSGFSSFSA